MSNAVTRVCWRLCLPPTQKAVLMCLADFCHDDGKDWHSIASMVEWTCLGKRTVIEALQRLERSGLIVIERRRGGRNLTALQIKKLAELGADQCATRTSAPAAPVHQPHVTSAPAAPPPVQEPHKPVREPHPNHGEPPVTHQEPPEREQRRSGKAAKRPLPDGFGVSPRVEAWAMQHGHGRLPEHLEAFKLKCQANGYAYADWDAAFMTAIRDDWAGLGKVDTEPAWRREQRERNEAFLGPAAAKRRSRQSFAAVDYNVGVDDDGRIA